MKWGVRILAMTVATAFVAAMFHISYRSHPSIEEFDWKQDDRGYSAQTTERNAQTICICGAYECFDHGHRIYTDIEPSHLAYRGIHRTGFVIVKDPEAGSDSNWGRRITFDNTCIEKQKNAVIEYKLTKYVALNSIGTDQTAYLKLSIK